MTAAPDPIAGDPIERVLGEHALDTRTDLITPGGNPACMCGWVGFGHRAHVAAKVREALQPTLDAAKAEALREAADDLESRMQSFSMYGRNTRAGWAVGMLRILADRAAALTPPQQGREDEGVTCLAADCNPCIPACRALHGQERAADDTVQAEGHGGEG